MNIQTEVFVHFSGSQSPSCRGKIYKKCHLVLLLFMGKNLGAEETIVTFALIRENAQHLHYSLLTLYYWEDYL